MTGLEPARCLHQKILMVTKMRIELISFIGSLSNNVLLLNYFVVFCVYHSTTSPYLVAQPHQCNCHHSDLKPKYIYTPIRNSASVVTQNFITSLIEYTNQMKGFLYLIFNLLYQMSFGLVGFPQPLCLHYSTFVFVLSTKF